MPANDIRDLLEKLYRAAGFSFPEIEVTVEPSPEAGRFVQFGQSGLGERDCAVRATGHTGYMLPEAALESLAEFTLSTKVWGDKLHTVGKRIACGEQHTEDCLLAIAIVQLDGIPRLKLEPLPFVPYPKDLPPISIANRRELCINCAYVWLEPYGRREPDFNHCVQMDSTMDACNRLSSEQAAKLYELSHGGVLCPLFKQTERYST